MRASLVPLALTLSAGTLGAAAFAGDDAKLKSYGRHLAQECTACHRIDGTNSGIPAIVGWDADRFAKTLEFYRTGERTNLVMMSVAKSLDPEQVRALAAYYATLPKAPAPTKP